MRGRVAKRVHRGNHKAIKVGASAETMQALWWGVMECAVEIINQEHGATAAELNFVRAWLRDNGVDAHSVASMKGALSKIAQAALAQPFELKQTGSSLGARHDDGNDDDSTS